MEATPRSKEGTFAKQHNRTKTTNKMCFDTAWRQINKTKPNLKRT